MESSSYPRTIEERARTLVQDLRRWAEDDVLGMRREVSMRRGQFVDVGDLERWAKLMIDASDGLRALLSALEAVQRERDRLKEHVTPHVDGSRVTRESPATAPTDLSSVERA